ncbi:AraC family transcriptional regulator N-terminal domain-containing protein [Cellvibrio sp. ARAG 10.3]|uniref:AraC family transcriptional regulator n=1 Tax=Cellvibrio sp. ARAG 10.3 TaxID=3451358 RepID=UPI003F48B4FA
MTDKWRQAELIRLIDKFSKGDGIHLSAVPGLKCIKAAVPSMKIPVVYEPSICLIVQGAKEVLLGEEVYRYSPSQFLMVSVDLPVTGQVIQASDQKPYLSLQIDLNLQDVSELIPEVSECIGMPAFSTRALFVGETDITLEYAVLRLVQLLESTEDISFLAPMIRREIYYRLLKGPYGQRVVQMAARGGNMQRISQVIEFLKRNFDKTIGIAQMIDLANMSPSSFHAHFKEVTAMSPLQYQKRLRLLEARRMMLAEAVDASNAAYRVGYESPSQFSREYSRMFGAPPVRDIESIRART